MLFLPNSRYSLALMAAIRSSDNNSSILSLGKGALFIRINSTEGPNKAEKPAVNNNSNPSQSDTNEDAVKVSLSPKAKKTASTGGQEESQQADLPEEDQKKVEELKARDKEVKKHEQAHLSSLGQYGGGAPSFEYEMGPDGKRYAVGGEVDVDLSTEKEPEETIAKMRVIKRSAMAPAEPSSADRKVASQAARIEAEARSNLSREESKEISSIEENGKESGNSENIKGWGNGNDESKGNDVFALKNAEDVAVTKNKFDEDRSVKMSGYQRMTNLETSNKASSLNFMA